MRTKTSFIKGKKTRKQGKRGKGRIPLALREAILQSFEELGGVDWLKALAKRSPSAYAGLLAKVLPVNIRHEEPEKSLFPDVQLVYPASDPHGVLPSHDGVK